MTTHKDLAPIEEGRSGPGLCSQLSVGGTVSSLGARLRHIPGGPEALPRQSLGGWPSTHLAKQANVVSARPVLDHLTVNDSPDVDVGPSHIGIRDPDTGQ